jgi:copper chaperone CopZ
MELHNLKIEGMGSNHCIMAVRNIITRQEGASIENIEIGAATVKIDEKRTSRQDLVRAIEKMGYKIKN